MTAPLRAAMGMAACAASLWPAQAQTPTKTLDQVHKGLSMGALRHARLVQLPKGTILRAGKLSITAAQLDAEIKKAGPQAKVQLKGHEIVMLENMATRSLLVSEARQWSARSNPEAAKLAENQLIGEYLRARTASATATDAQMKAFYNANKDMFGGATYEMVADDLRAYLTQQKRQEAVDDHINGLGKRYAIEIDSAWAAAQARTVLNNPVDRARRSGKPALVDFGSKGCGPCDMLAPILEDLKKTYAGKCEVIVVQVREQPMLGSRYGIQSIPVQIFFDKNGDEVFRHTGFWPKERLVAKLAEMGIR